MTIYHQYAPFYDANGQLRFTLLMGHYLGELLGHHPVHGRRVLDLACGTGTLALLLAGQGWDVVGLDAAEPMLVQARAKAAALDTPGRAAFVSGDMRALPEGAGTPGLRPGSFDLVTCIYDSLNYLLAEADLVACFAGVARMLRPGGLFVADMNTRHFLEHDWGTCTVEEQPGFVQVAQSHFDPQTGCSVMVLTGFAGDDKHGYTRFDETHIERAYPEEQVSALLEASGLHVEATYDCFTFQPVYTQSQRIAWVARRTGFQG
ncbi:MAG: class I SAM-dependent methyltransferase [Roseiflexaceae bacterium]